MDIFKESLFRSEKAGLFSDMIGRDVGEQLYGDYPEMQAYCAFAGSRAYCRYGYKENLVVLKNNAHIKVNFMGMLHEQFFNVNAIQ